MRITLTIDGGLVYLPARAAPRSVDVDTLPANVRVEVCALVDALRQSPPRPRSSHAPDARTYTIVIDDRNGPTTYRVSEPIDDARCAALVDKLRDHLG